MTLERKKRWTVIMTSHSSMNMYVEGIWGAQKDPDPGPTRRQKAAIC